MALVEKQLSQHEDAELRRLVEEQKAVRAEIERRQKVSNKIKFECMCACCH